MIRFLNENKGFSLFLIIILALSFGVITLSGTRHIDKMSIVLGVFVISYFLNKKLVGNLDFSKISLFEKIGNIKYLPHLLFFLCVLIFIADIVNYGGLPVMKVKDITTVKELTLLRKNIHADAHVILIYLSSWNMKALIPFSLVLFYCTNRKWFYYLLLFVACLYAFSMMQKSFILSVLCPILVILFYRKKLIHFSALIIVAGGVIYSLIAMASHITDTDFDYNPDAKNQKENTLLAKVYTYTVAIKNRILIIPAEMVVGWFDVIPEKKPFLYGDGYRLIADLKKHEYIDYNTALYPVLRPHYVERGVSGSVNVATFMRGYSNFGLVGLVVACFFLGLFFALLEPLFQKRNDFYWSINLFPILLLSSVNILTLLFSGGWGLFIVLFLIFKTKLEQNQTTNF